MAIAIWQPRGTWLCWTLPDGVLAGAVGNHVCGGGNAGYRAHGDNVASVLEHVGQKLKDGPKLRKFSAK